MFKQITCGQLSSNGTSAPAWPSSPFSVDADMGTAGERDGASGSQSFRQIRCHRFVLFHKLSTITLVRTRSSIDVGYERLGLPDADQALQDFLRVFGPLTLERGEPSGTALPLRSGQPRGMPRTRNARERVMFGDQPRSRSRSACSWSITSAADGGCAEANLFSLSSRADELAASGEQQAAPGGILGGSIRSGSRGVGLLLLRGTGWEITARILCKRSTSSRSVAASRRQARPPQKVGDRER